MYKTLNNNNKEKKEHSCGKVVSNPRPHFLEESQLQLVLKQLLSKNFTKKYKLYTFLKKGQGGSTSTKTALTLGSKPKKPYPAQTR